MADNARCSGIRACTAVLNQKAPPMLNYLSVRASDTPKNAIFADGYALKKHFVMTQTTSPDKKASPEKTDSVSAEPLQTPGTTGAAEESRDSRTSGESRPVAKGRHWPSTVAFVLTLLGWVALPLNEVATLVFGVAGLVMSVVALRQPRGAWRNLALVSIVASAVLLLVLALFWGVVVIALKML